jgi:tRNA1(Val) A37 N6-methylase TrmN6
MSDASLTTDQFLGDRLTLRQPAGGFRAGLDSVMLAAAIDPDRGVDVFEAGVGAGVAALCLLARCPKFTVTGIELQPALAELARANAAENGLADRFGIMEGDLLSPPAELARGAFDQVMTNPPFLDPARDRVPPDPGRATAMALPPGGLAAWLAACLRRLKPKGTLTLIHRADALGAILPAIEGPAGRIEVLPLWPRPGAPASRVLVRAVKGARGALTVHPGLVLHGDGNGFTAPAQAILREGAGLPWG